MSEQPEVIQDWIDWDFAKTIKGGYMHLLGWAIAFRHEHGMDDFSKATPEMISQYIGALERECANRSQYAEDMKRMLGIVS